MAAMCPLCSKFDGTTSIATVQETNGALVVNCPRCGDFTATALGDIDEATKLKLSGLARIEANHGRKLAVTADNVQALASAVRVPTTHGAYYDRVLELVAKLCKYPGSETPQFPLAPFAAEAFLPAKACEEVLRQSHGSGLIELLGGGFDKLRVRCRLTPDGWRRVDELTRQRPRADRAFVAMWFDPEMGLAYTDGFHVALTACGYEPPFRVDAPEHQERADEPDFKNRIDDRILAEIRRARFVVADATGGRPSVYYEAGFADGLGTPVVWTCRKDWLAKTPFDTRQNEHIVWSDPGDLKAQLAARIARRGWER